MVCSTHGVGAGNVNGVVYQLVNRVTGRWGPEIVVAWDSPAIGEDHYWIYMDGCVDEGYYRYIQRGHDYLKMVTNSEHAGALTISHAGLTLKGAFGTDPLKITLSGN